jgi:DNA-binding NarL/FixJ family response regulator
MTTRIILADDHLLVRAGIRSLVEAIEGAAIVGEANNGREALALVREHRPDLAIMDITMKEMNGIEATAQIRAEFPATRVLILSMHSAGEFVMRAIRAGANGYLVKDAAPLELRMAIESVMRDEVYLSPGCRDTSWQASIGPPAPNPRRSTRSPRGSARSFRWWPKARAPRRSPSSST